MASKRRRAGIERKILTSILWVGILPMTVAFIVGYITARGSQRNAVYQTLLTAAQKTAEGAHLELDSRFRVAANLATDPQIIYALSEGLDQWDAFSRRIESQLTSREDTPSRITLYGLDGNQIVSSRKGIRAPALNEDMMALIDAPHVLNFGYFPEDNYFGASILCPVRDPETGGALGYMAVQSGVNALLRYALGARPVRLADGSADANFYQILYIGPKGETAVVHLDPAGVGDMPGLKTNQPEESFVRQIVEGPFTGTLSLSEYSARGDDDTSSLLLAYAGVPSAGLGGHGIYILVYRPTSAVFSNINVGATLAMLGCILFLALLCVNAYRDVHNNIVRPVLLLNEGAQIVRQGDLDLKLKIGTGDEIEELASSFNQMAVALKINIRQLEESEEKYRNLVTSMRDGIYQTDTEGVITFLNPAGVKILGIASLEDALGRNMNTLFLEKVDLDPFSEAMDVFERGERLRVWMRRWDDRTICVELSRNRVYSDSGRPIGLEGNFRDVSKNVRLEEEARERSERISAINQIANVINQSLEAGRLYESLVVELKKLVEFDYAAVALLNEEGDSFDGRQLWPDHEVKPGYTFSLDGKESCAGWVARERKCLLVENLPNAESNFSENFPTDTKSCLCVPLYATGRIIGTLNLGSSWPGAFSKHEVEVLEQMSPHLAVAIRNAQLLINLRLSLEEVTRAREKLHEANEELKTLDEMKTNLLSNVSHELRTPLVSVMGYTDMILNGKAGPISSTQQEYLEISLRNIERLVTLIENLLDFSRLHRGDERLVFDTFDLVDCARTSMQIVQPVADSRDISVDLQVQDPPILVEGDKSRMGQVFNNLLSNAVKFNRPGGQVLIEMNRDEKSVEVIVSDTGIGIPEEALDKVFTRFYQYDGSSTRKYGGTGIGLSIAQDIVRLHGSSISVSSEAGEGSELRFRLALTSARRKEGAKLPGELPLPEDTHLLVELLSYDRALGVQVRNLLASEGMDLIHASSPENAIALAQKHNPDCILVDMGAEQDGHNSLDELLSDSYTGNIPILLLTNDDALYERYRSLVAARVKRSFRKSSLLGGVHHALSQGVSLAEPLGERVLCVDDDPEVLSFMRRCLEAEGFVVDQCDSGEAALLLLEDGGYGLILLDIAMPGMDGWETCKRIKHDPAFSGMIVYMVTAKPIDQSMGLIRECGADGFLLKPFHGQDLVDMVQGLELRGAAK